MTTDIKELLPCPFCNSDMSSVVRSAEGFCHSGSTLYVPCDCGAMGPEGKTIDDAIAAWNRRAPVEQLSAEPAAWMNPNESFAPDAFIWSEDDIHPEYNVPVFTHPAKTEQPSLSDAEIDGQIVHFAKLYALGLSCGQFDTLREYTHQVTRALLAQRQDSDKDVAFPLFLTRSELDLVWAEFRASVSNGGKDPGYIIVRDKAEKLRAAIANGAPK